MNNGAIKDRIKHGNDNADLLAKYLNKKYGYEFKKVSLEEDKNDMIDFRCDKTGRTAQFKCRENKSDIIFEAKRFYINNGSIREIDGRDCRTKAKLYICLSSDKKKIIVAQSESIKDIVQKEISKFDFDSNNILSCIKNAKNSSNKSIKLIDTKNKIQTWFKVDEGSDTEEYYKLLVFIPYEAIANAIKLQLQKNENLLDEGTW